MDKNSCFVVKDLLPLYVDGVVSEETAQAVRTHLAQCESCQEEYNLLMKDLSLPTNPKIQEENSRALKAFKSKWTMKKIAISVISSVLAVFLFFTVREYIMEESELFQPKTKACAGTVGQLFLGELSNGEWARLRLIKEDLFSNQRSWHEPYLVFDNPFYEKRAVNSGTSSTAVELRILDTEGNIVMEPFVIEAGTEVSLEQLEYGVPYIVEYKADGDYYAFTFH